MNSNRNDRTNAYWKAEREGGRFSYPEEDYNSGYGTSEEESYHQGQGDRSEDYRRDSYRGAYGGPENRYDTRGDEYSDYGPGYSTANDFPGEERAHGRLQRSRQRGQYGGYDERDYGRSREMHRRSEYPETYRSGMSGYMSEHVGDDSGRRDYNQNPGEGNLYGNRYGSQGSRPGNDRRWADRGYMSEDDYDRGSPFYRANTDYRRSNRSEWREEGRHRGKGPRNYRRTDSRIQEDINERLTDDPLVDASEVDVAVQNGEVTLTGTVDDREAKRRAEDIAESVSGVTHVENRMRVRLAVNKNPPPVVTAY
jgi:hypothetical protein